MAEGYVKYTKADFLSYADGFDYTTDIKEGCVKGYKSDVEIKKDMKTWELKDFQDFYGFTHKCNYSGGEKYIRFDTAINLDVGTESDLGRIKNHYD